MNQHGTSVIIRDPEILSGEPVFAGTRVPFQAMLDYLEAGERLDDFLKQFPGVTREAAIIALEDAKLSCSPISPNENSAGSLFPSLNQAKRQIA